jgi:DNA-binding winged helix-turn-helix (wHTH) protein
LDNVFRFARFEADRARYQLWSETRPIKLERIPLELLFLLLENRGKLVSRRQIAARLWGDNLFLDIERSINTAVRKIRKALEDDPHHPQFIETVVGQGYRFIASVGPANGVPTAPRQFHSSPPTSGAQPNCDGTEIRLRSFLIETRGETPVLTCDVNVGNLALGRLPLLDLELPMGVTRPMTPEDGLVLKLNGVRVALTAQATQALHAFSVSVLQNGLRTCATNSFHLSAELREERPLQFATEGLSQSGDSGPV